MSGLTWFLFESLGALSAALGVMLFILLVYWRRTGRARPLLVGLAIAVVLLVMQALVVTHREHAVRILRPIERGLVASHTEPLAASLAADFRAEDLDRDAFVSYVRRRLQSIKVRWVERWRLEVSEDEGDRFRALARYTADVSGDSYAGALSSTWSLTFVHTPEGWRIAEIHPVEIAGFDNPTWGNLDRR